MFPHGYFSMTFTFRELLKLRHFLYGTLTEFGDTLIYITNAKNQNELNVTIIMRSSDYTHVVNNLTLRI